MFLSFCSLKKMRSPILFLHAEDDHLVPIQIAQQVLLAQMIKCKLRWYFPRSYM